MWTFWVFIFLIGVSLGEKTRYDRHSVYRLTPVTEEQLQECAKLEKGEEHQFWTHPRKVGEPVDVMVAPQNKDSFTDFAQKNNLTPNVMIDNVQDLIDAQQVRTRSLGFDFNDYHSLDEIYEQLRKYSKKYKHVKMVKGGRTYEGRDIMGVYVSFSKNNRKRAVFVEAGIHAAEWIAPATNMYILTQILTSTDPQVRSVAESYDWYFFPSFNPDGYVYTHTTDRLWRKSRTPYGECSGADMNRNWDSHWMELGANNTSCGNFYGGPSPFSEVETRTLSHFISSIHQNLVGYISFHSYKQLFLIPYSYTAELLDNYEQLKEFGDEAADVLKARHGTEFEVGTFYTVLWPASGVSVDWVKGKFGVPITYTIELRDKGQYGFLLPPEQIIPTGEETFDAFIRIFQRAKQFYGKTDC